MLSQDEVLARRELVYRRPDGSVEFVNGGDIRVRSHGFVLVVSKTRVYIPNSNVIRFSYHVEDLHARRILEQQ